MSVASINDIRKELLQLDSKSLQQLCLRLARYKKENKELLNYLLFEAQDEVGYIELVKSEIDDLFTDVANKNLYLMKKVLRKILRYANRQIKYSSLPQTDLAIRIYFCEKMLAQNLPLTAGTVLFNLYQQQLKKITSVLVKLPEDEQGDYTKAIKKISK